MAKNILLKLKKVRSKVDAEISSFSKQGRLAAAMAAEGYKGGYRDCLDDVMLALRGIKPSDRGRYWWDND